ncbi:histidine kinase [Edaphobacter sp. 12200R-103]|nr:histidine kinase [Edaphobacter sp. 12200R-103]
MAFAVLFARRRAARPLCCRIAQGCIALSFVLPAYPSALAQGDAPAQSASSTTYLAEKSPSTSIHDISNWVSSGAPPVELQGGKHDIVILFDKATPGSSNKSEVRYRLVGYDADWQNTNARAAHYSELNPGNYRFEVQERDPRTNQWVSHAVTLAVGEKPEIYETWYFYLALLVVAIVLPAYLYRRRVQMIKGHIGIVLEERNRIARECHDTLMAGFAAISWQLEATAKLFHDSDLATTPAAKSCDLARSMVSHCQAEARRIIWDLRDSDEMTNLLSQALARTLSANHLREQISTELDVEGDEPPLPPGCVHHLVCIGQEAITNAIRHARPSNITVRLKYDSDALNLSIRDDGRGFQSSERSPSRHGHFGIPVMEERTRKLGGIFRLQSNIGGGTEVCVWVPFNAMQLPTNQEHHVIRWIGI